MSFRLKRNVTDDLFSKYIRKRDGNVCQFCGKEAGVGGLGAAHCFSRARKATRWLPDNAVAACSWCHIFGPNAIDKNQRLKERWFRKRLGKVKFELLRWQYHNPGKFQKEDEIGARIWLKAELAKFEAGENGQEGQILGKH